MHRIAWGACRCAAAAYPWSISSEAVELAGGFGDRRPGRVRGRAIAPPAQPPAILARRGSAEQRAAAGGRKLPVAHARSLLHLIRARTTMSTRLSVQPARER